MEVMRVERYGWYGSREPDLNGPHGQEWGLTPQRATVRNPDKAPKEPRGNHHLRSAPTCVDAVIGYPLCPQASHSFHQRLKKASLQ